uniref:VWFA domain-containing protein n=1 Tax=Grammatophora oceanica TaxID=210454 RepID=A0A7S1UXM7_9STRA
MAAPKKYVKVNGVMKLNPEYKRWKEAQSGGTVPATTVARPDQALPVVSSMEDHEKLNEGVGQDVPLAESTNATIEMMQEPEISLEAGMQPDEMVDKLGAILNKYEVPMGLMNKLMMLSEYQSLEFIIDDSGSMVCQSDTINPTTKKMNTRWEEAQQRLKEMVEILAYVPFQQIGIEFLNRKDRVSLMRQDGQTPESFLQMAFSQIDAVFRRGPAGSTPALEKLQESLIRGSGATLARYFFGDGTPNGGVVAQQEIIRILKSRQDPQGNPITFISVTNQDADVEWMKDAEEVVPYCSESDDFGDEMKEVLRDQGAALPYTKGFHLICQLVAAMNPDDLDAMDESVPFTKATLDNLLGIQSNEESYRHYFTCFTQAQAARTVEGPADQLKKSFQWNYNEFLRAPIANQIAQVGEMKQQLARLEQRA